MATQNDDNSTPWGDDFDAEKAWTLVQKLRAERDSAKADRDKFKTERDDLDKARQERENEGKTAEERATAALEAAKSDAEKTKRELWIERALRKHPVPDDLVDLLSGDTEESLIANAKRLSKFKAAADDEQDEPDPATPSRLKPDLKPGHKTETDAVFDADAIVKAARSKTY